MSNQVLIFSHYGYSDYLEFTLACARKTNPSARLIFLGDQKNKGVAERNGWEHYCFDDYESSLHPRFNDVFRHIQGVNHNPIKNGRDWLRFVFERWFFIESFVTELNITRFWHFDSDTMLINKLDDLAPTLSNFEFTVQCNNTCLNGIMNRNIVTEYCAHICKLFEDPQFVSRQQLEFDSIHPDYAFTEMRAFDNFKELTSLPWANLMQYNEAVVFDDCICQEHGFEMVRLLNGQFVKNVFSDKGRFYGYRDKEKIEFATLNLSWVPLYVFRWALESLDEKNTPFLKFANKKIPEFFFEILRRVARTIRAKLA